MHDEHHNHGPGVEETDFNIGIVTVFIAVIAVTAVFSFFLVLIGMNALRLHRPPIAQSDHPLAQQAMAIEPEGPGVQQQPAVDLQTLRAEEQKKTETYGWIAADEENPEQGIAHVPVDRAIEMIAENGFPEFEPVQAVE